MTLRPEEVLAQSEAALKQWGSVWDEMATRNGKIYKDRGIPHKQLLYSGIGKACIGVALGPSFEKQIEILKENYNPELHDIICVDKAIGRLLENGLKPKIVVLCDAGISYEKWLEPYLDQTNDIMLACCVTANAEWTEHWKGPILFFTNKDNIQSEKRYAEISGCKELIPAGSNVGNSVVILSTQLMYYDEWYLVGYDYCWTDDNYYAFSDPGGKRYYMKHIQMIDRKGELINTSQNLLFSSRWLGDYYQSMKQKKKRIYNCSDGGILNVPFAKLERVLKGFTKREITNEEKSMIIQGHVETTIVKPVEGSERLQEVLNYPVVDVIVRHVSQEASNWVNQL